MKHDPGAPSRRLSTRWPIGLTLVCLLATALAPSGCKQTGSVEPLHGDALLLASSREFLELRLALFESGDFESARRMWAERSLIEDPPPDDLTLVRHRAQQLNAADERFANGNGDGFAYYRLARSLSDVRWYREALLAARRATQLDPDNRSAIDLRNTLENLDRFRATLDTTATTIFTSAQAGIIYHARELPEVATNVAATYGYTFENLLPRALYLGNGPADDSETVWDVELSVIVAHHPPAGIRRPDGEVRLRRVELDHNSLPRYETERRQPWAPSPGLVGRTSELAVYHDFDFHRRTGVWLFQALERSGGAPPSTVDALNQPIAPGTDVSTLPGTEPNSAARKFCVASIADGLRLRTATPFFESARSDSEGRTESMRTFVRELADARMSQLEVALSRSYLDQLVNAELYGVQKREERRLLEGLREGPLPRWQLAQLIDDACLADEASPRSIAARSILRFLTKTLDIDTPDALLVVEPTALRDAALTIGIDRFGQD